ncbi:alpha/beta hydrolase [Tateyamaria sp. SN3-11]|uniref:alpha/beta hydrolase n=1 Tax=Tateyamaria sp. SN3-11 TaxID=3092147 RepID=UPI0039E993ED
MVRQWIPVLLTMVWGTCAFAQSATDIPDRTAFETYARFEQTLPDDPNAALAIADQMLLSDDTPDLRLRFAHAALGAGAPDRAVSYLLPAMDGLAQVDPRLTEVLDMLSEAHLALGEDAVALDYALRAFNSAKARMGGENKALLPRLDALEAQVRELRPELLSALERMREEIIVGNQPGANVRAAGDPTAVTVWYGTTRNVSQSTDPAQYFGTKPDRLTVGRLTVTIPENHLAGMIERPTSWSFTDHLDPQEHVVLAEIEEMARTAFAEGCCGANDRLLFVHGYNTSFHDGALRAAQLSYDLEFSGDMMFFSWPSKGSLYGYLTDAGNVRPTVPGMEAFLEIATRGEGTLHIIAHSMGNQYTLAALNSFLDAYPERRIGQLVLAAPDVDRDSFVAEYSSLLDYTDGITLYASRFDRALQVSRTVNGGVRLGDSGDGLVELAGVDAVDASLIEGDMLGHTYFADAPQLLGDIVGLVKLGWQPGERCGVAPKSGARQWDIRPEGCPVEQVRAAGDLIANYGADAVAEAQRRYDSAPGEQLQFWQGVLTVVDQRLND